MALVSRLAMDLTGTVSAKALTGAARLAGGIGSSLTGLNTKGGAMRSIGRTAGTAVRKTANLAGTGIVKSAPAVKELAKASGNLLFPKVEGGRILNQSALNLAEVAGVGIVIGGAAAAGKVASAVPSTPNNRLPQLAYSGNNLSRLRDNLGADGELALALHYNRHG